jgi:hypothetical protein
MGVSVASQGGIMKKLYLVCMFAFIVLLFPSAGCDKSNSTSLSSPSPVRSNAALFKEAARNMREAEHHRFNVAIAQPDINVKIMAEVNLVEGKSRIKVEGTLQSSNTDVQIITWANFTFVSANGGKSWTTTRRNLSDIVFWLTPTDQVVQTWKELTDEEVEEIKEHLEDGSPAIEQVGEVTTKHMTGDIKHLPTFSTSMGSSTATEGTVHIWVATESPSYVRRMRIDGKSGNDNISVDIEWKSLNEKIDIPRPIGTNEKIFAS